MSLPKTRGGSLRTDICDAHLLLANDKTMTLAEFSLKIGNETFTGTGNSRRVREDKYDERTGNLIAAYRALSAVVNILGQQVKNLESD